MISITRLLSGLTALCLAAGGAAQGFLRGGDISEIPEVEAAGGHYYDGKQKVDPFVLARQAGWNFVRFRVWNQPKDGYCDKAHTLDLAKRAKAQGLKISLDFHYSDWWADPGKQFKPAAWKDLSFEELVKAEHDFTKDVVAAMVAQGTPPIMVQIGNEITAGMLWPDGKLNSNDPVKWKNLGDLLKAGVQAVREAQGPKKILTMIHLDRGGDFKGATWWFDHILAEKVDFDTIGLSYYPFWHGDLAAFKTTIDGVAERYKKDVYVVETAYPWTDDKDKPGQHVFGARGSLLPGYPATPEGQSQFLAKVSELLHEVPGGRGKGILYWAPDWISSPGHHVPWDNMALFDMEGKALPGFKTLGKG